MVLRFKCYEKNVKKTALGESEIFEALGVFANHDQTESRNGRNKRRGFPR